jgi:hypothetical protein
MPAFALDQATTRPVSTLLLASRVTAESCTVAPIWRLDVAGETETDATGTGAGAVAEIVELPVLPSLEAVIWAVPALTALTRPLELTDAMPAFALDQATTRPVSTLLFASRVTAESCTVAPTWRLDVAGDTETNATGTGAGALTLSAEDADFPWLEPLIIALPTPTALTPPVASTVATFRSELSHVTVTPVIGFPLESWAVAVARAVCPTRRADGLTETETTAIGAGGGGITAIVA